MNPHQEEQKTTEDKAKLLQNLKLEDRGRLYSMPLDMSWESKMKELQKFA